MSEALTSFWIAARGAAETKRFGVTGFSADDALQLLRDAGYELPADRESIEITPGVGPVDLDAKHIAPNCGPAIVRGIWYPFSRAGV